jgi:hypothetical protein
MTQPSVASVTQLLLAWGGGAIRFRRAENQARDISKLEAVPRKHERQPWPKKKLLTDAVERLAEEEAPGPKGKTWAGVIAEQLLRRAREGDVGAIAKLASGQRQAAHAVEVG